MTNAILNAFGLEPDNFQIEQFGSGLINSTLKVSNTIDSYILQRINTNVFKSPEDIAENLELIDKYLKEHYPDYLFAAPLPAVNGEYLVKTANDDSYRLLPFIKGSHTVNTVDTEKEAFEASKQFGKFSRLLYRFDIDRLKYTLPDFHNLSLRFSQFENAFASASIERKEQAKNEIEQVYSHVEIVNTYNQLTSEKNMPLRVIHHDTKINNVLFDDNNNGLCVIDLDTIMPGYFFSDVGDMMRTYLSPANEEESDLDKIYIRINIFEAVRDGYMLEMGDVLTDEEKQYFTWSGELMIYMQAMRFLTDFLNNDVYYGSKYPGHNLLRAKNQLRLLDEYYRFLKS
jgi:Ser/Thr protein kinase RdoA (MazF antagonist)